MSKNSELKPKSTDKSTNNNTDKRLKNLKPAWEKGKSGNPNGYPKGQRHFKTVYREALIQLAQKNNKTPEEIEWEIVQKGILQARQGDYKFYKDLIDRVFGTALQYTAVLGKDGENLKINYEVIRGNDYVKSNQSLQPASESSDDSETSSEVESSGNGQEVRENNNGDSGVDI